jgi:hypothetical protein
MSDFVNILKDDWFIFKYEDLIEGNSDELNNYLGFEIKNDAEVPKSTKKAKVARKKTYGDWRNWFLEEDVQVLKPTYLPYIKTIGYDCDDWSVSAQPSIEPEFSSIYMKRLVRENTVNPFRLLAAKLQRAI